MSNKLCAHDGNFTVHAEVVRIHDSLALQATDHRILRVKAMCQECGMPFEFVGVPISAGPQWESATTTPDRLRVNLPVRPGASRVFFPGEKDATVR